MRRQALGGRREGPPAGPSAARDADAGAGLVRLSGPDAPGHLQRTPRPWTSSRRGSRTPPCPVLTATRVPCPETGWEKRFQYGPRRPFPWERGPRLRRGRTSAGRPDPQLCFPGTCCGSQIVTAQGTGHPVGGPGGRRWPRGAAGSAPPPLPARPASAARPGCRRSAAHPGGAAPSSAAPRPGAQGPGGRRPPRTRLAAAEARAGPAPCRASRARSLCGGSGRPARRATLLQPRAAAC